MDVVEITSDAAASDLARTLTQRAYERPVVVVTSGAGRRERWIDPEGVLEGVGAYADVYWMPTGHVTWTFKDGMPDLAQVYGDAARVYALDGEWIERPRASRLHMCFGPEQGGRIVDSLIAEALADAARAGLLTRRADATRRVAGAVATIIGSRAWVTLDDGTYAAVREELVLPGVSIDRLLRVGQRVHGPFDTGDRIVDVRDMLRPADVALDDYRTGDLVLARVDAVSATVATVELVPGLRVQIPVSQISSNPLDEAADLMSAGEVVTVRVERAGSDLPWLLSMLDVDDDAQPRDAPILIEGGVSWLLPAPVPAPVSIDEPEPVEAVPDVVGIDPTPEPVVDQPAQSPAPIRPDPRLLDPRRQTPPLSPQPPAVARDAAVASHRQENAQLIVELRALERDRDRARSEVERLRTARRNDRKQIDKLKRGQVQRADRRDAFLDPAEQLRHDVYVDWVERIQAAEKRTRRLPTEWVIGAEFMESFHGLPSEVQARVPEVVMEVLTGLADESGGRDLHRLRKGPGGSDPYVEREPGEYCWRVAVQRNTASAARLHYWKRGSRIELSRVVRHDDMTP